MRQIILDVETTGLDPSMGHKVIEIACVELINRTITNNKLHIYLNPDRESNPEALAVHGLTREFLSNKPRFSEIYHDLLNFTKDAEVIAHNAPFDVKFLNSELEMLNLDSFKLNCKKIIDSLVYARAIFPGKRNSLDALCERYKIYNKHRTFHGALLDAHLLAKVWLSMTRGQESLLIEDTKEKSTFSEENLIFYKHQDLSLKRLKADNNELQEHHNYLKNLYQSTGYCLWYNLEN
ncbi:MAG: DNA polymerase III subunit epsilon [Bordetella sp.]|nr:MAG: DNA polymerase III subunit epsilon [Bordetella sp.]